MVSYPGTCILSITVKLSIFHGLLSLHGFLIVKLNIDLKDHILYLESVGCFFNALDLRVYEPGLPDLRKRKRTLGPHPDALWLSTS